MKEDFDREMDSLLRRRARGTAESRLWGDGAGNGLDGAHLDADELGAFAEGALPAAARVAAASHLADCERCRGVAVGLARVVGAGGEAKPLAVAAAKASVESARPSYWRALFASLFAPRVMRFAVPVLALSLVGVISYVALRSKNGAALEMARDAGRQNAAAPAPPSTAAPAPEVAANANSAGLTMPNANVAADQVAPPVVRSDEHRGHGSAEGPRPVDAVREGEPSGSAAGTGAAAPPAPPPAAATEAPAEIAKAAPRPPAAEESEGAAKADDRERAETRDKSARSAETADEAAMNDLATQQQRRAANSRAGEVQMPDGGSRNQKQRGADNNASSGYGNLGGAGNAPAPKESPRSASRPETVSRGRAARQAPERKDSEDDADRAGETRAAAGHRFRREGSAWVDVNYKPSMPSTGVRRNTEAFRALVADVPEVGRVAAALGGEVIVVVRGRAYRIR